MQARARNTEAIPEFSDTTEDDLSGDGRVVNLASARFSRRNQSRLAVRGRPYVTAC
jgi:hypothetical protein